MKIAFFDTKEYDKNSFFEENKKFKFDIEFFDFKLNEQTVDITKGFTAVCCFVNDVINEKVIDKLADNGVKIIAMRCAGYNNVSLKTAYKKITIVRVPAYSPNAVAEYAICMILALNRKIHKSYVRVKSNNFSISGLTGFDLKGKTLGIIGTGKIGQILIKIAKGFELNVIATDKFPNEKFAKEFGFKYVDIDTIYEQSDIISLNCPLTPESYHLINEETIKKMKDNIMIINTGRGGLIDTKALIKGLKSKKIGSAGLDVYEEESQYFFQDFSEKVIDDDTLSRLLTFPNVLITSHQGFLTTEALQNIANTTLQNIEDFKNGKNLINEVCQKCGS